MLCRVIHARGLARTFRKTQAGGPRRPRGGPGRRGREIVGFLGPNGAGKTTTLRMLATLFEPTAGSATVAGWTCADPAACAGGSATSRRAGGPQPEALAGDELVDQAQLYGITTAEATARGHELSRGSTSPSCGSGAKTLSGGQRRRLDIALGLVHVPALVFLDEPTTGLDPQARANLWEHIRGPARRARTTVFLTTHYLDEADALCDRILVIDHGAIVAEAPPRTEAAGRRRRHHRDRRRAGPRRGRRLVGGLPGPRPPRSRRPGHRPGAARRGGAGRARPRTRWGGHPDRAHREPRPSLDDVFLALTGRSLRDAEAARRPPAAAGGARLMGSPARHLHLFARAMRMTLATPSGW